VLPDLARIALLGGAVALDRYAGWSLMLSQPIVAACVAGALVRPAPEWELWALRVPIGIGALLQLLLTDASLPAAQRRHETATAGVIGSTAALFCMERLHDSFPASGAGMLWVILGVACALAAAVAGGAVFEYHRARSRVDAVRAERLAAAGNDRGFEWLYWKGVARIFFLGAAWSVTASLALAGVASVLLPRLAGLLTARRIGVLFAALLGAGLAAAYHAHVGARRHGHRWALLGVVVALVLVVVFRGGKP
jgi:mannose/fructose/N-acetylgalactosamine-specific phosphotransferase system component IIC